MTEPRTPKQSGRRKTPYATAKSDVATVRETSTRAHEVVSGDAQTGQLLSWLNAMTFIADLVRKQRMSAVELEQLLEEIRARGEARHCATLSATTFNRVWDNPADAGAWDNWRPRGAKNSN